MKFKLNGVKYNFSSFHTRGDKVLGVSVKASHGTSMDIKRAAVGKHVLEAYMETEDFTDTFQCYVHKTWGTHWFQVYRTELSPDEESWLLENTEEDEW